MVRKSLEAVAAAYKNLKNSYYKGKNTDLMLAEFISDIKERVGSCDFKYDFLCGNDTVNIDGVTKNYIPKAGDTLLIDISVKVDGGWCDVCRTFFFGEPSEKQKKTFDLIVRSIKAGEEKLIGGAKARDIYRAVNSVYEESGKKLIHHAGHKIGESCLMQPQFLLENNTALQVGDFYTVESGAYQNFGVRLENDFLLTEDGAEDLFEEILPLNIEEYILK
jgi:Xaa-Pro aminopeptidase